ncbi:hypothetical protein OROHE_026538 [Orobanche hederae]
MNSVIYGRLCVYSTREKVFFGLSTFGELESWDLQDPSSPKVIQVMEVDEDKIFTRFDDILNTVCKYKKHLVVTPEQDLLMVKQYAAEFVAPDGSYLLYSEDCRYMTKDFNLLAPVDKLLLEHFNMEQEVFIFGNHRLDITLEDVLCLTGLPIGGKPLGGKPVICENTRDNKGFVRVFNLEAKPRYTTKHIISVACDRARNPEVRVKAVLLAPSRDGFIRTTYIQFIKDLTGVNKYAWGAALLAFLLQGIKKYIKKGHNGTIDGNMWICFFFLVRIERLRTAIGINSWDRTNFRLPLLECIVPLIPITHFLTYMVNLQSVLGNLSDNWWPYDEYNSSAYITENKKFGTLVVPLCCNNHCELHRPCRVAKQFEEIVHFGLENFEVTFTCVKKKQNRGTAAPNFKSLFEAPRVCFFFTRGNLTSKFSKPKCTISSNCFATRYGLWSSQWLLQKSGTTRV